MIGLFPSRTVRIAANAMSVLIQVDKTHRTVSVIGEITVGVQVYIASAPFKPWMNKNGHDMRLGAVCPDHRALHSFKQLML
jgi:hypothetical protein